MPTHENKTAPGWPAGVITISTGDKEHSPSLQLVNAISSGTHHLAHVSPATLELLEKWGLDVDDLVKAADRFFTSIGMRPVDHEPQPTTDVEHQAVRIRMSQRKGQLIEFLGRQPGPVTRAFIVLHAGIPAGSLSALLREPEFMQTEHGMWALYARNPKPGEEAPGI
jgi:hypothetical protein